MPFSNETWFVKLPDGSIGIVYADLFDMLYEPAIEKPSLLGRLKRIGKFT